MCQTCIWILLAVIAASGSPVPYSITSFGISFCLPSNAVSGPSMIRLLNSMLESSFAPTLYGHQTHTPVFEDLDTQTTSPSCTCCKVTLSSFHHLSSLFKPRRAAPASLLRYTESMKRTSRGLTRNRLCSASNCS